MEGEGKNKNTKRRIEMGEKKRIIRRMKKEIERGRVE